MTINKIDNGAFECMTDGGPRLGFPTGINMRRFSNADTVAIRNSEGIIISASGETASWPIERFIEHEGEMVAIGPWLEGSKAFESEPVSFESICRLLPAIHLLKLANYPMDGLYCRAVRWLPGEGVLIFPPKLARWMNRLNQDSQVWIHPDRSGEESWSFSLGMMTWLALAGSDPFAEEIDEARRERIRRGILPPMKALIPEITEEAETLVRRALIGPKGSIPSLEDWESFIHLWHQKSIFSFLTEEELKVRKYRGTGKATTIEKHLRNRRWFRKSGWKLLTAIAVTASILTFASAPIRKSLEKPVTAGMTAIEVAATYYNAIDAMDSETMDDCLARKVGKNDLRLITTIYVTTKIRQGYERLGDTPKASDWIENGKPDLPDGIWPWGITNLTLEKQSDGRIKAHYLFWTPPGGENKKPVSEWKVARTDLLSFTQGKRSIEISNIERSVEDVE